MNIHTTVAAPLEFNVDLDVDMLADQFRSNSHVRIPHILQSGAPELYRYLETGEDWIQLLNKPGGGAHEIPLSQWRDEKLPGKARILREANENACHGFQYSYAALRIPAEGESCADPVLNKIGKMLSDPQITSMLAAITGIDNPVFTDGQVTAYGSGDFLTGHDDDLAGSGRAAAFVLGLTPQWRLEWGGLLTFHDLGEVPFWGMIPQFNTLDLFAVPKHHSVSYVTPAAPRQRYSITGWLSRR
ncbi:2OG-Fe(II) oxygenase [Novosphingobium sp. MW5]|nr:2OG-Fe(II) oxygenase [Novosphingobium sp. MW5]